MRRVWSSNDIGTLSLDSWALAQTISLNLQELPCVTQKRDCCLISDRLFLKSSGVQESAMERISSCALN